MGGGRRNLGGRSACVLNREKLIERLKSCRNNYSTVEDITEYLRSSFRDYRGIKEKPFTRVVQQALDMLSTSQQNPNKNGKASSSAVIQTKRYAEDDEYNDNYGESAPRKKKSKKVDASEQRLQSMEELHVRRLQHSDQHGASLSSSSASISDDDEDEGGVSTSEDAIYEEKVEPEFDLMKSMLRRSYAGLKSPKPKTEEKSFELEVTVDNKVAVAKKMSDSVELPKDKGKGASGIELKREANGSVVGVGMKEKEEGPRFKDMGGMKPVLDELLTEVIIPLYHPQLPQWLGVQPMPGILLHGPPGCGKTKLARAVANEAGVPFYQISATEVVSGVSGASEENIRDLFSKAYRTAPSIIFIDEIDAIASKRENLQREMEKRIVAQLMTCMDESHRLLRGSDGSLNSASSEQKPGHVLVIGATNRPDAIDPALRRPGRFEREIALRAPDENARAEILSVVTSNLRLEGSFDLRKLARSTPGFVGADLVALANKAGNLALKRIIAERKSGLFKDKADDQLIEDWWRQPWLPEEIDKLNITMADFEEAVKMVQPSSKREGFSEIPNVRWEDVGGLVHLREEFNRCIVRRIKSPEDYEEFGVNLETGYLLYGPPGCGKTLIAKAVANDAGANFIHIKGPELLNKYVGESELAVRTIFSRARTCSPCIIFFDEVDALTTERGKEGGWVVERLLNQLLVELDGSDRRGIFVIGATNRPEVMDHAVLRPGRFGKLVYVPLPSADERGLILKALARKKPVDGSVDLTAIAQMEACENLSGADLAALMNEAAMAAMEEKRSSGTTTIKTNHFEKALSQITPSVSNEQKRYYEMLSKTFKAA